MYCPKCNSEKIKVLNLTYPKAYECEECKHIFVKATPALIDE